MLNFINRIVADKDRSSAFLLGAIILAALWNLALPLSRTVQEQGLKRYHLASANWAVWAVLQPIPSIYNFENRYWLERPAIEGETPTMKVVVQATNPTGTDLEDVQPTLEFPLRNRNEFPTDVELMEAVENSQSAAPNQLDTNQVETSTLNHFPTRIMTYSIARERLGANPNSTFFFQTSYRNRRIKTKFVASPGPESETKNIVLQRVETTIE